MFKLLTAVILTVSFQTAWSMDQNIDFSVKNIIRSKLWYEGVSSQDPHNSSNSNIEQSSQAQQMPEELSIALEKYES